MPIDMSTEATTSLSHVPLCEGAQGLRAAFKFLLGGDRVGAQRPDASVVSALQRPILNAVRNTASDTIKEFGGAVGVPSAVRTMP